MKCVEELLVGIQEKMEQRETCEHDFKIVMSVDPEPVYCFHLCKKCDLIERMRI